MRVFSGCSHNVCMTAAGVPSQNFFPAFRTSIRSAWVSTLSRRCSHKITATPRSRLIFSIICRSCSATSGSSMAVGSSKISSSGSIAMTDARFSICFCPPDNSSVRFRNQLSIPKKPAISLTFLRITSTGSAMFSSPKASSCHTRSVTIWLSGSCWTNPIFMELISFGTCENGIPLYKILPSFFPTGVSSGFAIRRSVVLPPPDSPQTTRYFPGSMEKLT